VELGREPVRPAVITKKVIIMATTKGNIIQGKLGNSVYSSLHGRQTVRAYKKHKKQPGTTAQKAHWAAISVLARLASDLSDVYQEGLHKEAVLSKRDPQDVFRKINYSFIKPEGVEYSRLVVSKGNVPTVHITEVGQEDDTVSLMFDGLCHEEGATGKDTLFLFAYCPALRQVLRAEPVRRDAGRVCLTLPADWREHPVHLYAYLLANKRNTSDTMYESIDR